MQKNKANKKQILKFSVERLQKVALKIKETELESFLIKVCEHYCKYLLRQKNRDAR